MAHGQWTEVEARSVLAAWKRSGLSVEKFARARGLVPQRLYWWKKKLGVDRSLALLPRRSATPLVLNAALRSRVTSPRPALFARAPC
jgi:hypothetical protein